MSRYIQDREDDMTLTTVKRSNATKPAMSFSASTATTASDRTTSTANATTGGDPPVAIRNDIVVNHALEALLETATRSLNTAGGNHDMQLRIDIAALVDAAAQSLHRSPAVNRHAHLSRSVQLIRDTVAHWYSVLIEGGILEGAIQETMNGFDNAN